MPAEIHFYRRSEPTQIEMFLARNDERGFRQIIFCGNCLELRIREPFTQHANAGRIAGKMPLCKCQYLIIRNEHGPASQQFAGPANLVRASAED